MNYKVFLINNPEIIKTRDIINYNKFNYYNLKIEK